MSQAIVATDIVSIRLSAVSCVEDDFIEFIHRYKHSLESLSLSYIQIPESMHDSWRSILSWIGQHLALKSFKFDSLYINGFTSHYILLAGECGGPRPWNDSFALEEHDDLFQKLRSLVAGMSYV